MLSAAKRRPVLALTGHGSIWLLCLLALLLGAGSILFANASSAITPMLVGGPELPKANSWLLSAPTGAARPRCCARYWD